MDNIIVFGGTLEGRKLAEYYREKNIGLTLFVATEYGESLIEEGANIKVHSGRLDSGQMKNFIETKGAKTVIDATHPYAKEVTANIKEACKQIAGVEYIRVLRESSSFKDSLCRYFPDIESAVKYLNQREGNILLTTGSKELTSYSGIKDRQERVFARVLPLPEVAEQVAKLGYRGKNLICMQGPFSEELNLAMIKMLDIRYLVTKDTGAKGGFPEKVGAASKAGIETIIIGRPEEESGMSFDRCIEYVNDLYKLKSKRTVTICGMGMGDGETMTVAAKKAIENADAVIGAKRLLNAFIFKNKEKFEEISTPDIVDIIKTHKEFDRIVVAMSGDTGFYSGTLKLSEALEGNKDFDVQVLCGISSPVYFCNRIGRPWQNVKMYSAHGRDCNFVSIIKRESETFFLLGGKTGAAEFLKTLSDNGLGFVTVYIGENLSYDTEKITKGTPENLKEKDFESLAVALVINEKAYDYVVTPGIPDEKFIRGEVPMTKEEVRAVSLSKLRLTRNAVVYDIGAGTGSVSLECAMQAYCGKVFAIEKNAEGCALIEENSKEMGITNLEVICGTAPEALNDLPVPTHVFIGGSSGNMDEIIKTVLKRNPEVRVVVNTITLESLAEVIGILKNNGIENADIVNINVSKNKRAGRYNLMTAQNPVYVISFTGGR